jgi:hypothetical protein
MGSADERGWQVESEGRAYGLHAILLKREYVLAWSQFLYAEGTSEEVQAYFSTHDVVIRGTELSLLLSDLASQRVTLLREPGRVDKFRGGAGPRITELEVRRVEAEGSE